MVVKRRKTKVIDVIVPELLRVFLLTNQGFEIFDRIPASLKKTK